MPSRVISDLIEIKKALNISNADLAVGSRISEASVSRIFSGKSDNVTLNTLMDLADALGAEVCIIKKDAPREELTNAEAMVYHRTIKDRDDTIRDKDRTIEERDLTINDKDKLIKRLITFIIISLLMSISIIAIDTIRSILN